MSYENARVLLEKYKDDQCTDGEKAMVEKWLFEYGNEDLDLSDEKIDKISLEIWSSLPKPKFNVIKGGFLPRIAATAAALLVLTGGLYLISGGQLKRRQRVAVVREITPGRNRAELILGSGAKISLTDISAGQVAVQGEAVISKTGSGEISYRLGKTVPEKAARVYNTVSTSRGGQFQLMLADGTHIWLNALSSITYPVVFARHERSVVLTGEAYFEVAHNRSRPFRVIARGRTVEDLGTSFDIEAYPDEPAVRTTLLSGRIKVSNDLKTAILLPGEQVQIKAGRDTGEIIRLRHIDTDASVSWKNGLFQYNKAGIDVIMRQLARWYEIDVSYADNKIPAETFTGSISRDSKFSQVLDILSFSGIRFNMNGKKIHVMTK